MNIRINQEISLETEIPFLSIQEFFMTWEINKHSEVNISGIIRSSTNRLLNHDYSQGEIKLIMAGNEMEEASKVLFCGLVETFDWKYSHGVTHMMVKAISASVQLDEKKTSCTFQNSNKTYAEVARDMSNLVNGKVISTTGNEKIEKPVICYKETIWEFEKRMASLQSSYIISDVVTGRPNIWFGMRRGEEINEKDPDLKVEIKKNYADGEKGRAIRRYCMESRISYSLGDWLLIYEKKCVIYKKIVRLEHGETRFVYWLSEEKDLKTEPYYNSRFTGMGLIGTIEKTNKETFRIRFDMDNKRGDYSYTWRPESGNSLYAMPEEGSKVEVQFMNHDEKQGIGVRCLHSLKNQDANTENKLFETSEVKIGLFNDSIELATSEESLNILDDSVIDIEGDNLAIKSSGKVKLYAKNIRLSASTEVKALTGLQ
ncbi:hypothetical protein [Lacrimispora sphenoides]|uniref:Gp5/Type VI secretion system Vgr protein OB-fold domain-containing protein n=1 Tax=Lacrimispora sphenoides JCM 1415 TaxID=1297793 RepID=A0ABY1C2I0_9FIRM|nr:hypothetical protein [Lacrimispora sphenoides]SET56962.1 hypothetical protein SAMN02745906_0422 [[Clostridium] sphenoides JCM 1415]SUY49814.1 YD repeat containing protein [Lacrimispora sphenoides]